MSGRESKESALLEEKLITWRGNEALLMGQTIFRMLRFQTTVVLSGGSCSYNHANVCSIDLSVCLSVEHNFMYWMKKKKLKRYTKMW